MNRYALTSFALAIPLFVASSGLAEAQNLIRNGTFERNTAITCDFNLDNSTFTTKVIDAVGYGSRDEICVMKDPLGCGYGSAGPVGPTKLGLAGDADGFGVDAFSMPVQGGALPAGRTYSVSLQVMPSIQSFAPGIGTVRIGVSTNAMKFGTQVAEMTGPADVWTLVISSFDAPITAEHLTLEAAATDLRSWTHIDALRLQAGLPDEANAMSSGVTVSLTPGVIESGSSVPATFRVDFGERAAAAPAWLEFEVEAGGELQTITHGPIQLDALGRGEVTFQSGLGDVGSEASLSARFRAVGLGESWVSPRIAPEVHEVLTGIPVAH